MSQPRCLPVTLLASVFLAVLLLSCTSTGWAVEIEGTVQSVDTAARKLSITRKTASGEKTVVLDVSAAAGDLSYLKKGDKVTLDYDPEQEVITKLGAGLQTQQGAMEGVWKVTAEHEFGRVLTKDEMRKRNRHITIKGNTFSTDRVIGEKLGTYAGSIQVSPEQKTFDFKGNGPNGNPVEWFGIYKIDGDSMALCYRVKGEGPTPRPTEFKSLSDKPGTILFECKKEE